MVLRGRGVVVLTRMNVRSLLMRGADANKTLYRKCCAADRDVASSFSFTGMCCDNGKEEVGISKKEIEKVH